MDRLKKSEEINMLKVYYKSYFDAMLFSEIDDNYDPLDCNYDVDDISEKSLIRQIDEVERFIYLSADLLAESDYDLNLILHDFYFTRNRHGVGFWEADYCSKEIGNKVTELIHNNFSEIFCYVNDNGIIEIE